MSKKILVAILTLALTLAIAAPAAFAADSDATIGFGAFTDPGVIDPTDPPDDPDEKAFYESFETADLPFGNVDYFAADHTYESTKEAGLVVKSITDWDVTVSVSAFEITGVTGTADASLIGNSTLAGFELTLTPVAGSAKTLDAVTPAITPKAVTIDVGTSDVLAEGEIGMSGCEFHGELLVLANTATPDTSAQAELTWDFVAA